MKFNWVAILVLVGVFQCFPVPARLTTTNGCHIDRLYQSDNGFAVSFTDCSVTPVAAPSVTYSTVYLVTNFSDGWSKSFLSILLAAKASKMGLNITYDSVVAGNLFNLSIMKSSVHSSSMALKLLDLELR